MRRLGLESGNLNIQIVVSPCPLKFYVGSPSTHTQLLRVYNIFDVPIKYEVSFASSKEENLYEIRRPTGTLDSLHTDALMIKHRAPTLENCCEEGHYLRVRLSNAKTGKPMTYGKIGLQLINSEKKSDNEEIRDRYSIEDFRRNTRSSLNRSVTNPALYWILGGLAIILIPILFLPLIGDQDSSLPSFLHVDVSIKYVAYFLLGAISPVLFKAFMTAF